MFPDRLVVDADAAEEDDKLDEADGEHMFGGRGGMGGTDGYADFVGEGEPTDELRRLRCPVRSVSALTVQLQSYAAKECRLTTVRSLW